MSDENLKVNPRPELTANYCAIDGIFRSEGPLIRFDCDGDKTGTRIPAKREIRPDIERLLSIDDREFNIWYSARKEATENLLENYELFASIPELSYGGDSQQHDMSVHTHVKYHLESLRKGLDFLARIKERREECRVKR